MQKNQELDPDLFLTARRDPRGRFAQSSSGNPRGRPRGIPNPKCKLRDLRVHPVSSAALARLVERKPYLLRRLAAQLLPPAPPRRVTPRRLTTKRPAVV